MKLLAFYGATDRAPTTIIWRNDTVAENDPRAYFAIHADWRTPSWYWLSKLVWQQNRYCLYQKFITGHGEFPGRTYLEQHATMLRVAGDPATGIVELVL